MAEEEDPLLADPGSPQMAAHVNDYERFTKMMFRGAIACLIIGILSLILIKSYW
jgi:hypothetical protein